MRFHECMQGSFDLAIACCAVKSILHIFGSYTMKYLENHFTLKRRIGIEKSTTTVVSCFYLGEQNVSEFKHLSAYTVCVCI
jgi:hypothetical protein